MFCPFIYVGALCSLTVKQKGIHLLEHIKQILQNMFLINRGVLLSRRVTLNAGLDPELWFAFGLF